MAPSAPHNPGKTEREREIQIEEEKFWVVRVSTFYLESEIFPFKWTSTLTCVLTRVANWYLCVYEMACKYRK